MRTRTGVMLLAIVAILLMPGSATIEAQSTKKVQYRLEQEGLGSADGSIELRQRLLELRGGEWVEVDLATLGTLGVRSRARDDFPYQDLLVQNMNRWRNAAPIRLRWTRRLRKHLKEIESTLQKFVNRRRGHSRVPPYAGPENKRRHRIGVKILDTPEDTMRQLNFSNTNDTTKTNDNRFFHNVRKDVVIRAWRGSTFDCEFARGSVDFICDLFITEGDIHFASRDEDRNDFFKDLSLFNRQVLIAWAGKFLHGQDSSAWPHHLQGNREEVTPKDLRRNKSRTNKESRSIDNGLYSSPISNNRPARAKPLLFPSRNSVIYLNDLRPTYSERESFASNAFAQEALIYTTLGGFSNRKRLQVDIKDGGEFEANGPASRATRARPIVRARGFSIDRDVTFNDGSTAIETHLMSRVSLGREDDFNDLALFMCDNGKAAVVNGVGYDFVRMIKVIVKGHPDPNSGRKRVSQTYIAAYDEEDAEDERSCEDLLENR